jgi:hypothetical protein
VDLHHLLFPDFLGFLVDLGFPVDLGNLEILEDLFVPLFLLFPHPL